MHGNMNVKQKVEFKQIAEALIQLDSYFQSFLIFQCQHLN